MTGRRVAVVVTCTAVAALAAVFALLSWDHVSRVATIVSALCTVAALGVGVWAGLGARSATKVLQSGKAIAEGRGSQANTGLIAATGDTHPVSLENTGDAQAKGGGDANTGVKPA